MTLGEKASKYLESISYPDKNKDLFEEFWNAEGRTIGDIEVGTPEDENNITAVREVVHKYVKSLDLDKRPPMRNAINFFFGSCVSEWSGRGSNRQPVCMMDKCMDSTEKTIYLLKYLQGGEEPATEVQRTMQDIADHFGISNTAAGSIWGSLEYGINLLGSDIKITRRSIRGNNYDNTVHPVFLALNLTEAFFLTEVLRRVFDALTGENKRWQDTAADIAYDVRRQLSENYCTGQMERLHKQYYGDRTGVDFSKTPSGRMTKKGYRPERIDDEEVWLPEMLEKLNYCGSHAVEMKIKGDDETYTGSVHYEKGAWYFICSDGHRKKIPPAETLEKLREVRHPRS